MPPGYLIVNAGEQKQHPCQLTTGLTHGGFYRHFGSKEELVTEALAMGHRDFVAGTIDAANQGAATRHNATEGFRVILEKAAPFMRSQDELGQTEMAIGVLTNMIGALTMSRMVDDPTLSEKILEVTRQWIAKAADLSSSKPRKKSGRRDVARLMRAFLRSDRDLAVNMYLAHFLERAASGYAMSWGGQRSNSDRPL